MGNKNEYQSVQLMRAMACVLVVLSHVPHGDIILHSDIWTTYYGIKSFVRIGVCLFLMISGYLLLDKNDDIFLFYTKRAKRVLPPFICYMLLYYVLTALRAGDSLSARDFVEYFFGGGPNHMWYIFSLIGVYLFMPFLRKIFQNATTREKWTYCILWFVICAILPFCKVIFGFKVDLTSLFTLNSFAWPLGFVFVGACLKTVTIKKKFLFGLCSFACCVAIATITISWSFLSGEEHIELTFRHTPLYYIAAITAFMALKDIKYSHIPYCNKVILELSTQSFGIYMSHGIILGGLRVLHISPEYGHPLIMNLFATTAAVLISCLVVKYAKKIPYIRHVVG